MDIRGKNIGAAGDVRIDTQNNYFAGKPQSLPNSIPSISGFVGREDYLADLRESYKRGSRCFVLHGGGGVGKSALALRFAEEIAGEYEAKAFVDMQGLGENPLSAHDAMFNVVRQFEREIPIDVSDDQLEGIFVQFVQSQPTLIVLDNARDKQSVEALKRAKACFITTSREAFTLTDIKGGKKIAQMSAADARNLLFAIAGEERLEGRADELARLAGYLPMALKPVASLLAEDELETAADLITRYRNKKELLKERVPGYDDLTIEASFELSYESLPDEMQKRWRRLSVFPSDFEKGALTAVLEISPDEAQETQKHLRRFNLLEVNPETKRFSLHDLGRVFTDTKLSEEERFRTQFLHAKYYAQVLNLTGKIRGDDRAGGFINALKIVDIELNNIRAGQKWTADNIDKGTDVGKLCCHYSTNDLLLLRLHPREYISWQTAALKAARKLNNKIFEGNFSQNLGVAYCNLGEYSETIEYFEQALKIARDIRHRQGEGNCLGNLGAVYIELKTYQKAIDYFEQALVISREIGDRNSEATDLGNIGKVYSKLVDYPKAIDYYEQSLKISQELGDWQLNGNRLSNLGSVYNNLKNYQKAIDYHNQSLKIRREIGDRSGEGNSLANLGNVYHNLGETDKACTYWKEALAILKTLESPNVTDLQQSIEENCR